MDIRERLLEIYIYKSLKDNYGYTQSVTFKLQITLRANDNVRLGALHELGELRPGRDMRDSTA